MSWGFVVAPLKRAGKGRGGLASSARAWATRPTVSAGRSGWPRRGPLPATRSLQCSWVSAPHGALIVAAAAALGLGLGVLTHDPDGTASAAGASARGRVGPPQQGLEGIVYYETRKGGGREIQCGDTVTAHLQVYSRGIEIDTTLDGQGLAARPKAWTLCTEGSGPGAALRGLDLGVRGMRVGGKRVIDVPPELAYGKRGRPPLVPPDTPICIKAMLMSAKKPGVNPNMNTPGSSVY